MLKVENRESAHLRSRVKDLSVVPNVASFNGLFAAITPIAKAAKNAEDLYEPVLVRDNETLIANFGDPRIDPEKYIDLYSIMQVVGNGGTCYVAKVDSGNAGVYHFPFLADPARVDDTPNGELSQKLYKLKDSNTYVLPVDNKYVVLGLKGNSGSSENPDDSEEDLPTSSAIFYSLPYTVINDEGEVELSTSENVDNAAVPTGENEVDYAGRYTWSCDLKSAHKFTADSFAAGEAPSPEDLEKPYVLVINLPEDEDISSNLVATGTVDPAWGAEAVALGVKLVDTVPAKEDDKPVYDSDNKPVYIEGELGFDEIDGTHFNLTFVSEGTLANNYIVLNKGRENFVKALADAGLKPENDGGIDNIKKLTVKNCENSDGKVVITVEVEHNAPDVNALLASIKEKLTTAPAEEDSGEAEEPTAGNDTSDGFVVKSFALNSNDNSNDLTRESHAMIAYSSMAEELKFNVYLSQAKPYSLHVYFLNVDVANNGGANVLGTVKVKLESTTTNQGLVNALNSALGTVVRFELLDPSTASACGVKERGANSIAQALLDEYCDGGTIQKLNPNPTVLEQPIVIEEPSFQVNVNNYIAALTQYKAKKYVGCLMADMVCPVTNDIDEDTGAVGEEHPLYPLNSSDRRTLHYKMKDIAFERKDTTVILSTPYTPSWDNLTVFTINDACDWVASQGSYADLWEYGQGATTDYATQSFYLEMYFSWLEMQCNWIVNGAAKSKKVKVAPANLVVNNVLKSWRERGVQYPVAGDQGGVLPETCSILVNPKTKLERDQLVQYRINPIWDTGTRGVQIFGNETLNAGYTDLNAAHIARALVYIRSTIDEYTEKLKFSINSMVLWDQWKAYVSQNILEPLKSSNCLAEYRVAMGTDTTSREEIANRTINGIIQLIFYQSAEIFDLTYVVYSSATTIDEAMANT